MTDWIQAAAEEIAKLDYRDGTRDNIAAIIRRHHEASKWPELRQKPAPDWVRDDVVKVDEPGDWEGHNR